MLFLWDVPDALRERISAALSAVPRLNLMIPSPAEEAEFVRLAPDADVIIGWRPSPELFQAAARLSLYIFPGVGVQHLIKPIIAINEARAASGGPPVTLVNGPGNTYFTAQHAVALLFALTNRIISNHNSMAAGYWRAHADNPPSLPLRDRKIGFLGYGEVNRKAHRLLSGCGAEISALKRSWSAPRASPRFGEEIAQTPLPLYGRYTSGELDAFLTASDTVIAALPLTGGTRGMIGARELSLLGTDGIIVNVGRGDVIEEGALYDALALRNIAGAAIDVWYEYRPGQDESGRSFPYAEEHPFHDLDNIVLSPHRAASPLSDIGRWDEAIENIRRFASCLPLLNVVDLSLGY